MPLDKLFYTKLIVGLWDIVNGRLNQVFSETTAPTRLIAQFITTLFFVEQMVGCIQL